MTPLAARPRAPGVARRAPAPARARRRRLAAALLIAAALAGCATPRTQGPAPLPAGDAERRMQVWGRELQRYVAQQGHGDPAVLARLPQLRAGPNPRPAQIVFRVNDLDATVPGSDGYDLSGLLLGRIDRAGPPWYLFVVGSIQRRDGQPAALADLRLLAMSFGAEASAWIGPAADAPTLQRYAGAHPQPRVLRFPEATDRFELVPCAPAVCVEEAGSGARWRLE